MAAMSAVVRVLGSPRLTLFGFAALGLAVAGSYVHDSVPAWTVALALAALALNLAAALWRVPALRRGGLGVFHVALLGCLLLVAYGRLTHFSGRLPIVDGQGFDPGAVETVSRGSWHGDGYRELRFGQGPFTVSYAPGVRREHTVSQVLLEGDVVQRVGDDRPLKLGGYRFYTTFNKGFAPVLTWTAPGGVPVTGAVMLPSYPLNDWQQEHRWDAPDGPPWRFWLRQTRAVDETGPWTLDPRRTDAVLVAEAAGQRFELRPGDEARGEFGVLRYEWLAGWMGYRIFYDPTLLPLLVLSVLGVLGLARHLWSAPPRRRRTVDAPASLGGGAGKTATGGGVPAR